MFQANEVEAVGDAREDVYIWGLGVVGEVIAGVSEFDSHIFVELFGIGRGKVVEFAFS